MLRAEQKRSLPLSTSLPPFLFLSLPHPYSSHRRQKKEPLRSNSPETCLDIHWLYPWKPPSVFHVHPPQHIFLKPSVRTGSPFCGQTGSWPPNLDSLALVGSLPASLPAYCSLACDVTKPSQPYWPRGCMLIKAAAKREGEGGSQKDWICCFTD